MPSRSDCQKLRKQRQEVSNFHHSEQKVPSAEGEGFFLRAASEGCMQNSQKKGPIGKREKPTGPSRWAYVIQASANITTSCKKMQEKS